jgi:hypothetical protein
MTPPPVVASGAKQTEGPFGGERRGMKRDCFVASLLAMTGKKAPRNDKTRTPSQGPPSVLASGTRQHEPQYPNRWAVKQKENLRLKI